ncbi:D-2-hydroxyacid dehydrogenase [Cohnella ginsengisoli]|uniref:D-2-hydroxyacid dehydrogenase n=1 Tax=Cohnella ginsengisoli TaxID=425004 RepID=A0A9X4QPC9_9BACL|nr:D-2-hydroxyacid dehydrogenase [Cohnella ginsengisoli]MDG0793773.1 D-2-hydroxyacid dehydrogenase [Cohnella ginsengisoli]
MKIVVLDGYTLNPGDQSWSGFERLGQVEVYERTAPELAEERAREARIVLTNKTPIRAELLAKLPSLEYIGVLATGYDIVDVRAAGERGIAVTNVPGYGTDSVAQSVFALLLELCRQAGLHDRSVKAGEWASSPDFSYWKTPLTELSGKTMGIVGYGRIGEAVARIAHAFGMKVLAYKRHPGGPPPFEGFEWASLPELLESSDAVSLHCPLTTETEEMINRDSLARMKRSAFLINTARGRLIAEQDLADCLNAGGIAGAGLDVLSAEPPPAGHPLLSAANCIVTPHQAWATREARERLMATAVGNLEAYLAGKTANRIV